MEGVSKASYKINEKSAITLYILIFTNFNILKTEAILELYFNNNFWNFYNFTTGGYGVVVRIVIFGFRIWWGVAKF